MKIVPPSSYTEAYNKALNLESEQKTKKKKNSSSDSDDDESSGEDTNNDENSSKKVHTLQKDMIRMMEFKNMQKETKGSELWCKTDGHTKGSCPKNQFCDICQIMGHLTKECPFNMKTRGSPQVLLTQEASPSGSSGNTNNAGATSGGYRNNSKGQNNNNNGS